jgi:hypothetical protein
MTLGFDSLDSKGKATVGRGTEQVAC